MDKLKEMELQYGEDYVRGYVDTLNDMVHPNREGNHLEILRAELDQMRDKALGWESTAEARGGRIDELKEEVEHLENSLSEITQVMEKALEDNKEKLDLILGQSEIIEEDRLVIATLQKTLGDILDIIDGPDMKAAISSARIHGVTATKEVSQRNGAIIRAAYKLLGKERPK